MTGTDEHPNATDALCPPPPLLPPSTPAANPTQRPASFATRLHAPSRAASSPHAHHLPRILLASQSPRRRQLLLQASIEHTAQHPGLDDAPLSPGNVTPEQWVQALAYLKAASARHRLDTRALAPGQLVILGADTVVYKDSRIIGQPRSREDAARILRTLADGSHRVITGVALIDAATGARELFHDASTVTLGSLTEQRINTYLDSDNWRGKAGAYNYLERLDDGWPLACTGDPTTVMGLPMNALPNRLRDFAARCAAPSSN